MAMGDTFDKDTRHKTEIFEEGQKAIKEKADKIRAFRKEASRLASIANKRVERLERNDLQSSPAYQAYLEGGGKFGVKGKTYNEVQSEVARLKRFIDSNTSTVKGVNNTLKEMAKNTGIKYKNLTELRAKSTKFFELASKVEQYLRTVEDMASALGYQKIWEAINKYTQDGQIDLSSGEVDIDSMVTSVSSALAEYDQPAPIIEGWYSLKKDDLDEKSGKF